LKNLKKCPDICFAPDKNVISRTFKIRGTLVFLCPREREREREREGKQKGKGEKERVQKPW
jgi:hypothetical protein